MTKLSYFIVILVMNTVSERRAEGCKLGDKECTSLDLRTQQLTIIKSGMFEGMASLVSLDLSFNEIRTVESNAFQGLNRLTYLELKGNQINYLPNSFIIK